MKAILTLIFLALLLILTLQVCYRSDTQKEMRELELKIDSVMQHRSNLDIMYWNHLEKCAFELK
jgi:hypothetical protein